MNPTKELFDTLGQVLSDHALKLRTFVADYRDDYNNYYNEEIHIPNTYSNDCVVYGIMEIFESQGYTVYSIYEILNGYGLHDLNKMSERNIKKAIKHVKRMYADIKKERA